jgi:hypothetical protein
MALFLWGSTLMLFCRTAVLMVSVLIEGLRTRYWSTTFRDLPVLIEQIALLSYVFRRRCWLGRHEVESTIPREDGKFAGRLEVKPLSLYSNITHFGDWKDSLCNHSLA